MIQAAGDAAPVRVRVLGHCTRYRPVRVEVSGLDLSRQEPSLPKGGMLDVGFEFVPRERAGSIFHGPTIAAMPIVDNPREVCSPS